MSQRKSLTCLEGHYFETMLPQHETCLNLRSLTINSLNSYDVKGFQDRDIDLLLGGIGSLESLTIGFEEEVLQAYKTSTMMRFCGDGGALPMASEIVINCIVGEKQRHAQNVSDLLTPESLRLTSFDFDVLLEPSVASFLDFSRLTNLALESCTGVIEALHLLATRQDHYRFRPSQLRSLTIRTELTSVELIAALEGFICSLSELTDLCLLFESPHGGNLSFFPERILNATGKTLKTLIIEGRVGPRHLSSVCNLWPASFESLYPICDSCPNLVELGVALDWNFLSSCLGAEVQV